MVSVKLPVKFLILILGILVVFFGILSVIVIQRETSLLIGKAAEQDRFLSRTIVADLKDNMLAGRPRSTLKLIESLRGAYSLVRLEVLRKDGSPAFGHLGPGLLLPQISQTFETGQTMDFEEDGMIPLHTNVFPLKNESECRRCHGQGGEILGVILISHKLDETIKEIRSSKRQLAILFSSMLLVTGMLLYLTVRKLVLSPLQTLHSGAEVIGTGDLNHRITIASRDEFSDLAGKFNEMAGRLQETYDGLESTVKARTAELNENIRLMQGILSNMSSGVALLSGDGRVKLINPHGAWILGRDHEYLVGKNFAKVVPETAAFLSARAGTYGEITVRTPDERTMPVGFTTAPFPGSEGEQDGFIVVFHDLTELKALQGELLDKERFASMGRVVAGVAHEIRNPLFGINAIGQIFERDLKDPGHRELAQALLSEAKRLNQLVEELLIYGRPMKLKREDADLRILWEEVLDMHHDELQRWNIKVTGDYAVRHPVAYFDPHQVRQVFLNLLRNSIEAMPRGGTINTTMLLANSDLLFQVTDTGIGMPKESLEHIFELFFTTKPKGTGLGLAICRKIMRDHGGDITIDSVEGKGTIATITLPYRGRYDDKREGLS